MNKAGGLGLLVIGAFLIIVGVVIQSDIFDWLLDLVGILIIVGGVIVGVVGIVQMLTGRGGSDDF